MVVHFCRTIVIKKGTENLDKVTKSMMGKCAVSVYTDYFMYGSPCVCENLASHIFYYLYHNILLFIHILAVLIL